MKKNHKVTIIVIALIVVLGGIQTLPILFMKPLGAKAMSNDFINLHYEELYDEWCIYLNEKQEKLKSNYNESIKGV